MSDLKHLTSELFHDAQIFVVKMGSALLVNAERGEVNAQFLAEISAEVAALQSAGKRVLIVSSGAVALGNRQLGLSPPLKIEEKQASAAIGQVILAHAWMEALGREGLQAAQILLSPDDTETRRKHLNARATLTTLMKLGVIPIINENDTVSTAEIRFGDNDRLAARVAAMVNADLLILLSDIDGLYTADPRRDPNAEHLSEVEQLTPELIAMAGAPHQAYASGGMVTKLEAARIATAAGCSMIICDGHRSPPLSQLQSGARFTIFKAATTPQSARQRWISGALNPKGSVVIDVGAARAICAGRSLLSVGVTQVMGHFDQGDLVQIEDLNGVIIGYGLSNYHSPDAAQTCGLRRDQINELLGSRGRGEMIHADHLVVHTSYSCS